MAIEKTWNWQQKSWPDFTYNSSRLKSFEDEFLHSSGILLGAYLHIDSADKLTIAIDFMSDEALKTSEIEGEILSRDSVQSSIRKQFGLSADKRNIKPAESGIAEMMVDLYKNFHKPLSHDTLFAWHSMLMKGARGIETIGAYRKHNDPMQIISARLDNPKIHFEAPPSRQVYKEMQRFIVWFNASAPDGKHPLPAMTRAGIAHLYFESIHPFEDGNGRIGRSICEKILAQHLGKPAILALSQTIYNQRKKYYEMLEKSNKSTNIDVWLEYFAKVILQAQNSSLQMLEFIIAKSRFYSCFRDVLNPRQRKAVERIFRAGVNGFSGGFSAENYIAITGTSRATATRDLTDLVQKSAFSKIGVGKGTRYGLRLETATSEVKIE